MKRIFIFWVLLFLTIFSFAQNFSANKVNGIDSIIHPKKNKSVEEFKITHSESETIIPGNTPSCNFQAQFHYENSYYLAYDLKNDFNINGAWIVQRVEVAIEDASAGNNFEQPFIVNLWVMSQYNHSQIIQDSLTLLGSDTLSVFDSDTETLKSVDFSPGYTVAEDKILVVEFLLPDGEEDGNLLFLGSNNDRVSDSLYIKAPHCDVNEPLNVSQYPIMFPEVMIIANIYGEYASPNPQIQAFNIEGQIVDTEIKNEPDYTIKVVMPADTVLNELTPTIQIPAGFQVTPASGVVTDFSQGPVTYTVDNNFLKVSQSWEVDVVNAGPDIIGANLPQLNGDVLIDGNPNFTVTIPVTEGSNLSDLSPDIFVYDGFVCPESGTSQDFSSGPVLYTVSHESLPLSQDWQVSVIETPLGINTVQKEEVRIFPNPANDFVLIKAKNFTKAEVFGINGKKILTANSKKISVADLSCGLYFIKITANGKIINKKLFVNR